MADLVGKIEIYNYQAFEKSVGQHSEEGYQVEKTYLKWIL